MPVIFVICCRRWMTDDTEKRQKISEHNIMTSLKQINKSPLTLGHMNGTQNKGKKQITKTTTLIIVQIPNWLRVLVISVWLQYGQVILVGRAPKSRRGGWYCETATDGATPAAAAATGDATGRNSVTVSCLPSLYVVVTDLATIGGDCNVSQAGTGHSLNHRDRTDIILYIIERWCGGTSIIILHCRRHDYYFFEVQYEWIWKWKWMPSILIVARLSWAQRTWTSETEIDDG